MRTFSIVLVMAVLAAACGGSQEQPASQPSTAPATPSTPGAPASAPDALPAPSEADLHGAPRPTPEDLQELHDVSRDLQAVGAGQSGADRDLGVDLARFASDRKVNIDSFVAAVSNAIKGRSLDQATARRLAVQLYVAINADRLSAEQRKSAATALQQTLTSAGAARAQADAVVSAMPQPAAANAR